MFIYGYGRFIYTIHGVCKSTHTTGGHHLETCLTGYNLVAVCAPAAEGVQKMGGNVH
jgi:hypothetical protein